jgi:CubicO group peptidase (beta-lactamase class C family)
MTVIWRAHRLILAYTFAAWLGLGGGVALAQDRPTFPTATPESQHVPGWAVRRLVDEVDGYVKAGTIVGGELLVIKNRKAILHEVFGDRDREDKMPMTHDTIFNVRSMTKPLTGVAVQMLVDDGKLGLSDPVAKFLPGFASDKSRALTIEQLLEHRSGLPLTILKSTRDYKDLQAQANAVGEKGPKFKPGEKFWYSDAGSDAAAAVVER